MIEKTMTVLGIIQVSFRLLNSEIGNDHNIQEGIIRNFF